MGGSLGFAIFASCSDGSRTTPGGVAACGGGFAILEPSCARCGFGEAFTRRRRRRTHASDLRHVTRSHSVGSSNDRCDREARLGSRSTISTGACKRDVEHCRRKLRTRTKSKRALSSRSRVCERIESLSRRCVVTRLRRMLEPASSCGSQLDLRGLVPPRYVARR